MFHCLISLEVLIYPGSNYQLLHCLSFALENKKIVPLDLCFLPSGCESVDIFLLFNQPFNAVITHNFSFSCLFNVSLAAGDLLMSGAHSV